jgi:hypothetical protein
MATTIIDFREELPKICARCGAPATTKIERVFRHQAESKHNPQHHNKCGPANDFFGAPTILVQIAERDVDDQPVICSRAREVHHQAAQQEWQREREWQRGRSAFPVVGLLEGRFVPMLIGGALLGVLGGAMLTFWVSVVFEFFTVRLKVVDPTHVRMAGIAEEFDDHLIALRQARANQVALNPRTERSASSADQASDEGNPWKGFDTDPFEKLS